MSDCMLRNGIIRSSAGSSCSYLSPSWLKVLLKVFYFLNIYCTFLQVKQKTVTLVSLEKGLNQVRQFGFGIEYADLGNLSLLFPKVIQFIEDETMGRRPNNSIAVIKSKIDMYSICPNLYAFFFHF